MRDTDKHISQFICVQLCLKFLFGGCFRLKIAEFTECRSVVGEAPYGGSVRLAVYQVFLFIGYFQVAEPMVDVNIWSRDNLDWAEP